MAHGIFNIAKGRAIELYHRVKLNDPANSGFVVALLKAAESREVLRTHETLSALLAAAGNTEADFTNYARVIWTDASLAVVPSPDHVAHVFAVDFPDPSWLNAGGTLDNVLQRMVIGYDPDTTAGDDTQIVPVAFYEFAKTTNGTTLTYQFDASGAIRGD